MRVALSMPEVVEPRTLALSMGTVETDAIRTETFNGKEYTVVPVVAVVEGVLFGANATVAEFAPAAEFGKFPATWNGRPVVLNHPMVDGNFVSAGDPQVLEDYGIGHMFNTFLDGTKLKTEAWLDHARIAELGGVFQETFDRILAGETVEVSVGAFIDAVAQSGTFNGKSYGAVWSGVVPDHLAFLEAGMVGACSVADGCGVPRLNSSKQSEQFKVISYTQVEAPCCDACANKAKDKKMAVETETETETETQELSEEQAEALRAERRAEMFEGLVVESIDPGLTFENVRQVVNTALHARLGVHYYDYDIIAITSDQVVYSEWCSSPRYAYMALTYSVDGEGNVTFSGDPVPVNVMTKITPRTDATTGISTNERNEAMSGQSGQEEAPPAGTTVVTPAPVQLKSFSELLAEAPADVQAQFNYGMQAYNARKTELIAGIKALSNNPYSDEQLNGMDVPGLENLSKLANVPSYVGRGAPPEGDNLTVNNQQQTTPKFAAASRNFLADKE